MVGMSDEWYRGEAWDEEANALFERRIARARNHKAYYLWMKARAISECHPADSDVLFQRSMDCDDEFEAGRALNSGGAALAERGDIDGALDLLARCARGDTATHGILNPTASWDFALLAGSNRKRERYCDALDLLGPRHLIPASAFAAQAGLAFICYDQGKPREAREHAVRALERALEKGPAFAGSKAPVAPIAPFPEPLFDRLLVIAEKWDAAALGEAPAIWPEAI